MNEAANARVTALIQHQLDRLERADPELWLAGSRPEDKISAELNELTLAEKRFASDLLDRLIAHEDDQGSDAGANLRDAA